HLSREGGDPVEVPLRIAVLPDEVLALDIAEVMQQWCPYLAVPDRRGGFRYEHTYPMDLPRWLRISGERHPEQAQGEEHKAPNGAVPHGGLLGAVLYGEDALEVVDPHLVPAQDQLLLVLGHAGEVAGDGLARLREGGVEVRVVRTPHHLVHADQVAAAHAGHIVLEGGVHLAAPVVGGVHLDLGEARAEAPGIPLQPLQVVRDPADVVLDRDDLQLRMPIEHTSRDHFSDGLEGWHW